MEVGMECLVEEEMAMPNLLGMMIPRKISYQTKELNGGRSDRFIPSIPSCQAPWYDEME